MNFKQTLISYIMLFSANLFSQDLPEPEFANVPMWYDLKTKELRNLERPQVNVGARVTGMTSGESYAFIAGTNSPVKFDKANQPTIIFKTSSTSDDPATVMSLIKMQINDHKGRNQREYIMGSAKLGQTKTNIKIIDIDFKKIKPGVYQIKPFEPLDAGEYVLGDPSKRENIRAFAFGIFSDEVIDTKKIKQNSESGKSEKSPNPKDEESPSKPEGKAFAKGGKYLTLGIAGARYMHFDNYYATNSGPNFYSRNNAVLKFDVEFAIHQYVGLGLTVGVGGDGRRYAGGSTATSMFSVPVGLFSNFHIYQYVQDKTSKNIHADKLDIYAGINIGSGISILTSRYNISSNTYGYRRNLDPILFFGAQVGVKYFFNPKVGVFAEFGFGKSFASGGLALKL